MPAVKEINIIQTNSHPSLNYKLTTRFSGISNESIALIPLLPLTIPSHVSETVFANGVTAPNPVITTRRELNLLP